MYKTNKQKVKDGMCLSDFLFDNIRPDLIKPAGYEAKYWTMVYNAIKRNLGT